MPPGRHRQPVRHGRIYLAAVTAVTAFNLWSLRATVRIVSSLNDGAFHAAYVRWATDRIESGRTPFDGVFTQLGTGFPVFHHYQVLPHVVTGAVGAVTGPDLAYRWSLYLLLALWPICVYASGRLFGLNRAASAGAAVVAPFLMSLPGYGFERGSFLWRGYGMWSLAWGMWFFPFALALAWRAIHRQRSMAVAALLMALTITSHALTGYLALVIVAVFALVAGAPLLMRLARAAAIGAGALAASAWLLVPAFRDKLWTRNGLPEGTFWRDSFGARKVLGWLVHGELFDYGRWPVVTVLAAIGLVSGVVRARRQPVARAVLAIFGVSLVLFFGRPTLGVVVDILPARDDLFLPRMIVGVHLAGILLAGIGLSTTAWAVRRLVRHLRPTVPAFAFPAAAVVATVLALAPAWSQVQGYDAQDREWIDRQRAVDATDGADFAALVDMTRGTGGRVYAGLRTNWGANYRIGDVPAVIQLTNLDVDSIGFTGRVPALTEPSEGLFDDTNPADYELFDVRYAIEPTTQPPPSGGTLVATRGRHRLYSVPTTGLIQVADATTPIATNGDDIDVAVGAFLRSDMATRGEYPILALKGTTAGTPTLPPGTSPVGGPGNVEVLYGPTDGAVVGGVVDATRPAVVVLKMSAHDRWSATVDGKQTPTMVVAPGFVAVPVDTGRHRVEFTYDAVPFGETLAWFALGALALGALWLLDRRSRVRPASPPPDDQPVVEADVEAGAEEDVTVPA